MANRDFLGWYPTACRSFLFLFTLHGVLVSWKLLTLQAVQFISLKFSGVFGALLKTRLTGFPVVLLTGDAFFVLLHTGRFFGWLEDPRFSLEVDRGFPEIYQYLKLLAILLLLFRLIALSRIRGYLSWLFLFIYLLLDDALMIHETVGGYLVRGLNLSSGLGLRGQDFGELLGTLGFGLLILGFLAYAYFRGSVEFRRATQWLGFWIAALAFFGIFFDLLHVALATGRRTGFAFGLVEDGGEMLVLSILVVFVFYNLRCAGRIESSPFDLLKQSRRTIESR